jgi:hypothetical protein
VACRQVGGRGFVAALTRQASSRVLELRGGGLPADGCLAACRHAMAEKGG